MFASIARAIQLKHINKFHTKTIRRCFCKKTSSDKLKIENTASDVTRSIKEKFAKRKHDQDKSTYTYMTRKKIQNASGFQDIKKQLRKCTNVSDVMNIMIANKKCEDVQVGTTAIRTVKELCENKKVSRVTAMKHIDEIWNIMNEYVVGMDCAAYTEYFHAYSLISTGNEPQCRAVFNEMIKNKIMPDAIVLNTLLGTCRRGDIKAARYYWKIIVTDLKCVPEAECWAEFIAVCAKVKDVKLAEQCFAACPYKNNVSICGGMMSAYKNNGDIDKVLEMRGYMEQEKIEMNIKIYNIIIDAYRTAKQWQNAVNVIEETLSIDKWNKVTINLLLDSKIGILKMTDDFIQRKEILRYIEFDIANYYKECGESEHIQSFVYGNRMLDAYVSTYRNGFGSATFKECCSSYNVQYWEDVSELNVPTINLFVADRAMAKAILEHIFLMELDVFQHLGLNIMLNDNKWFRQRFNSVDQEDVNSILSSLPTPMTAVQQNHQLLHIPSEQTKYYASYANDDEPLFGDD
eukprot:39577_1